MKLPPLDFQEVEPVGWAFENWLQENFGIEEEGTDEIIEEEEETEVIDFEKLEPGCKLDKIKASEWKENDHYAILGLQDIRFKATAKQIKQVHKALVLKFHPDKLGRPAVKRDEENFAIITKSADILSDPVKRRAFDSVDPKFNNSIPKENDPNLKTNFYGIFAPVFERNARWALQRSKVVSIGQDDDDRKTVGPVNDDLLAFYKIIFSRATDSARRRFGKTENEGLKPVSASFRRHSSCLELKKPKIFRLPKSFQHFSKTEKISAKPKAEKFSAKPKTEKFFRHDESCSLRFGFRPSRRNFSVSVRFSVIKMKNICRIWSPVILSENGHR